MAQALVNNNAYSTLAAGISAGATSLTVATGHGARFPVVSGGNFFFATLVNSANTIEIVKVLSRAGDVMTVTRGQDGTSASAYLLGDRIELRPTAALFNDKLPFGGGTLTGPLSVPAGAAITQVPQVQEVVKRSGDTMTGTLTLPTIQGTGGVVALPTGHRIISPDVGGIIAPGMMIQQVSVQSGALIISTVAIPWDDTIPQITEGTEAFNVSITPKFATSKLRIDITLITGTVTAIYTTGALFLGTGADALAAATIINSSGDPATLTFTHHMTAPGTGTYIFRARYGGHNANASSLNGYNGIRKLGGVSASSMTITEIAT